VPTRADSNGDRLRTLDLGSYQGPGEAGLFGVSALNLPVPDTPGDVPPPRAIPMTVFSQIRPWRTWLQEWILRFSRLSASAPIRDLSFIHFVRFAVVRTLPGGPRLRHPLLLFESNYNGSFENYIDTFSESVPKHMKLFWGTSYGFPGPLPCTPFKAYIDKNEFVIGHYYRAYPEASVSMIVSALELDAPHQRFYEHARHLDPEEFGRAYRAFVTDHQERL